MQRLGWLGAALLLTVGCGSGTGEAGGTGGPADAGPDAVEVILDGGGEPAKPPDGASKCPAGLCNYQTGKGCPIDHPTCLPAVDGVGGVAPACDVAGAATSGAACAKAIDCAAGLICAAGVCRKLCCGGDWTGCGSAKEHCIENLVYGDGKGGTITTSAMLCYPVNDCDALQPAGCTAQGTTCQIADPTGATACLPEGPGGAGQACPCKGGFTCVVANGVGECRRLCKAVAGGGDPLCQAGEGICIHYVRDPTGVGECTPQ